MQDRWVGTSSPYLVPSGDTWGKEAAALGRKGGQRITFVGEVDPPKPVAEAFRLEPDQRAILRRRQIALDGRPVELVDSYWPGPIAKGTPLERSARIQGGAVALLGELGWRPAQVEESVIARRPTAEEQSTLALDEGEWVLVLTRTIANRDGVNYEVTVMCAPASMRQLNYSMKVG